MMRLIAGLFLFWSAFLSFAGSVECLQTTPVLYPSSFDQPLIGVKLLDNTGSWDGGAVSRVVFVFSDSTPVESLKNFKLWYCSSRSYFDPSASSVASGSFSLNGKTLTFTWTWSSPSPYNMAVGDYVFLTAQLEDNAPPGASVDVTCTAFAKDGSGAYSVNNPAPSGAAYIYDFSYRVIPYYRLEWLPAEAGGSGWGPWTDRYLDVTSDLILFSVSCDNNGNLTGKSAGMQTAVNYLKTKRAQRNSKTRLILGIAHCSAGLKSTVADAVKSERLINDICNYIQDNGYDGVDIDWEYPDDSTDYSRYVAFVAKLKPRLFALGATFSIATNDNYLPPPKALMHQCDFVNFMTYDRPGDHSNYEAHTGAYTWAEGQGVNKAKVCAGLPFYSCETRSARNWDEQQGYGGILANVNPDPNVDRFVKNWGNIQGEAHYFNGIDLIQKKCLYSRLQKTGGVMIWCWDGDAPYDNNRSLARATADIMPAKLRTLESAVVWYVDAQNGADLNDGKSWTSAKKDLQETIARAEPGDEIRVSKGTVSLTRRIELFQSVTVSGGWDQGSDTVSGVTVLNRGNIPNTHGICDISGSNVRFENFVLDGQKLDRKIADGGALRVSGSNNTVRNCVMKNAVVSGKGGGICNTGSGNRFERCQVVGNTAGGAGDNGAGIYTANTAGNIFINTLVAHNESTALGKAYAAGICAADGSEQSRNKVINCTVVMNRTSGGEAARTGVQYVELTNTVLWGNNGAGMQGYNCTGTRNAFESLSAVKTTENVPLSSVQADTFNSPCFIAPGKSPGISGVSETLNYRVDSRSVLINRGTSAPFGETDLDGHERVQWVYPDIGAYESAGKGVISGRLSAPDSPYSGAVYAGASILAQSGVYNQASVTFEYADEQGNAVKPLNVGRYTVRTVTDEPQNWRNNVTGVPQIFSILPARCTFEVSGLTSGYESADVLSFRVTPVGTAPADFNVTATLNGRSLTGVSDGNALLFEEILTEEDCPFSILTVRRESRDANFTFGEQTFDLEVGISGANYTLSCLNGTLNGQNNITAKRYDEVILKAVLPEKSLFTHWSAEAILKDGSRRQVDLSFTQGDIYTSEVKFKAPASDLEIRANYIAETGIRYVTVNGSGAKRGYSWDDAADASKLNVWFTSDTVVQVLRVAEGEYAQSGERLISKAGLQIVGGFKTTDGETPSGTAANTILKQTSNASGLNRVLNITGANVVLDRFTVTGGSLVSSGGTFMGVGIYADTSVTIRHTIITGQRLTYTGSAWQEFLVYGLALYTKDTLTLENCVIQDNMASGTGGSGPRTYLGSALYANGVSQIRGSIFRNNSVSSTHSGNGQGEYSTVRGGLYFAASSAGSSLSDLIISNHSLTAVHSSLWSENGAYSTAFAQGAGIYAESALTVDSVRIENCSATAESVTNGTAISSGAGVYAGEGGVWRNANVSGCQISASGGNTNTLSGGGIYLGNNVLWASGRIEKNRSNGSGAGIYIGGTHVEVQNALIAHNESAGWGAGLAVPSGSSVQVTNATIVRNKITNANYGGGIGVQDNGSASLKNSIIWGNTSGASAAYQDIWHGTYSHCAIGTGTGDAVLDSTNRTGINGPNEFVKPSAVSGTGGFEPASDWLLKPSSAMVNFGDNAGLPEFDLDGGNRIWNNGIADAGALELQSAGILSVGYTTVSGARYNGSDYADSVGISYDSARLPSAGFKLIARRGGGVLPLRDAGVYELSVLSAGGHWQSSDTALMTIDKASQSLNGLPLKVVLKPGEIFHFDVSASSGLPLEMRAPSSNYGGTEDYTVSYPETGEYGVSFFQGGGENYESVNGFVQVRVTRGETGVIESLPVSATADRGDKLASSVLSGGVVKTPDGDRISGQWFWKTPETVLEKDSFSYAVYFEGTFDGIPYRAEAEVPVQLKHYVLTLSGATVRPAALSYLKGERLTVTASEEDGRAFDRWTGTGISLSGRERQNPLLLTMPANAVELSAVFGVKIAPPEFSVDSGRFDKPFVLHLTHDLDRVSLYYALNDSSLIGSARYEPSKGILIDSTVCVTAWALASGFITSDPVHKLYTIPVTPPEPVSERVTAPGGTVKVSAADFNLSSPLSSKTKLSATYLSAEGRVKKAVVKMSRDGQSLTVKTAVRLCDMKSLKRGWKSGIYTDELLRSGIQADSLNLSVCVKEGKTLSKSINIALVAPSIDSAVTVFVPEKNGKVSAYAVVRTACAGTGLKAHSECGSDSVYLKKYSASRQKRFERLPVPVQRHVRSFGWAFNDAAKGVFVFKLNPRVLNADFERADLVLDNRNGFAAVTLSL